MTIYEAIKHLEKTKNWYEYHNAEEQVEAHKLGIEALKRCRDNRAGRDILIMDLLPGETKEKERRGQWI